MKKLNQKGFGAIEGILVAIIVLLIIFIGYYVWHSNRNSDDSLDNTTKTSQSADKSSLKASAQPATRRAKTQNYLVIREWNVKIPLTQALSGAYYHQASVGTTYLSLSKYKDTNCAADQTSLGSIERFTTNDRDDSGNRLISDHPSSVQVGGYYYSYSHPQSACDGNKENSTSGFDQAGATEASKTMNDFKAAVAKITAAN